MQYAISRPSPVACLVDIHLSLEDIEECARAPEQKLSRHRQVRTTKKGKERSALEAAAEHAMNRILQKEGLRPLSSPVLQVENEETMQISCTFEVLPPIPLPEDLSRLELHLPDRTSSTALQDAVNALLSQHSKLVQVKERRSPQQGDIALVDVTGRYNGKRVSGMCAEHQKFRITDETEQPELLQVLHSLLPGQEGHFSLSCPEEYPDPLMRGKTILFSVRLISLYREERPAFDQVLAEKLGFKKLSLLKQALYEFTMQKEMRLLQEEARKKLLERVVVPLDFPVPSSLVVRSLRQRMSEAREFFRLGGTHPEETEGILKRMRDECLSEARKEAKIQAFLLALAEREKLQVTMEETEKEIRQLAESQNESFESLRNDMWEDGTVNDIQDILLARKALNLMAAQASIVRDHIPEMV